MTPEEREVIDAADNLWEANLTVREGSDTP